MNIKHLVSISHNDLDGFGCQFLLARSIHTIDLHFGNADYQNILDVLQSTLSGLTAKQRIQTFVLFSDLSMNLDMVEQLLNYLQTFMGIKPEHILFVDHHESTRAAANKYPSQFDLNTDYCATWLVHQQLKKGTLASFVDDFPDYDDWAARVNAYDLHVVDHEFFRQGTYLSDQVMELGRLVPTPLMHLRRQWIFSLLDDLHQGMTTGQTLRQLDSNSLQRIEQALQPSLSAEKLADDNQSVLQKIYQAIAQQVVEQQLFDRVEMDGIRVAVMQKFGSVFFAICDDILDAYEDVDACLHINPRGNISLRSQAPIEIHELAKRRFGGGGHPHAAGGRLPNGVDLRKELLPQIVALFE